MDQSYSETDISLSPTQILDRLQLLRQLQILQHGKLQKQRLQFQNSPEINSNTTEIVSNFSNNTSYNTFRSLLHGSDDSQEMSPCPNVSNFPRKENLQNVIEGISVLNISEESEFITNSPISTRSSGSVKPNSIIEPGKQKPETISNSKNVISLDDMPILSPKRNFEELLAEKIKNDKTLLNEKCLEPKKNKNVKKPFLRRGEGTARFGIKKKDLVIQNTRSLPWRKENIKSSSVSTIVKCVEKTLKTDNVLVKKLHKSQFSPLNKCDPMLKSNKINLEKLATTVNEPQTTKCQMEVEQSLSVSENSKLDAVVINLHKRKHPIQNSKVKTWAAVLSKEQDEFLRQLKQSDYYKNFISPAKSTLSDTSYSEDHLRLTQEREQAEQNMFELLENKVSHESFNLHNSFFNRFLRNKDLDFSGESTPIVMQKYLSKNPNLLHILPDLEKKQRNENCYNETEACDSVYSECSENCSTVSSCSTCKTVTQCNLIEDCMKNDKKVFTENIQVSKNAKGDHKEKEYDDKVTSENEIMNTNMIEMNSKLIATSELLTDRLRELEDEIETFRKENANLTKMREEVDLERQKFYEEKTAFEQKFNEDKILSEYYLAEEKEKLNKQKQMYDKYVRDIRGRLNKKEKDEITNLKKEINDLKEEIKIKDAKSTSIIARLRNQIKIIEKDKKSLEDEVDKLKKENRRIQHSNDITRRLTNIKYLEQINKKLSNMTTKDTRTNVKIDSDIKYKAFEIERQSRTRKIQPVTKDTRKPRAKSVPNLHVTSRYAKYFSQKDSLSEKENNKTLSNNISHITDNVLSDSSNKNMFDDSESSRSGSEDENKLEHIYNERFKSLSPTPRTNSPNFENILELPDMTSNEFFIQKSTANLSQKYSRYQKPADSHSYTSKSPTSFSKRLSNSSKSSCSIDNEQYVNTSNYQQKCNTRSKSPVSILSNRSYTSQKSELGLNKESNYDRLMPSPEPTSSKTSFTKTNLTPTVITKPDGSKEFRFPNGNIKIISADEKYSKFIYYNGDIKENFYNEGRIKYYYAESKTYHTTHPDGLEILEFPDGQIEKRYKDGSSEIRLPNGSIRYYDPKNEHVREEWRFPDGAALTVSANGEQRIVFANGQVEVHAKDHKRREFPDGTIKLVYNDGTSETRYASGRVRIKDKQGNLIMDSAPG